MQKFAASVKLFMLFNVAYIQHFHLFCALKIIRINFLPRFAFECSPFVIPRNKYNLIKIRSSVGPDATSRKSGSDFAATRAFVSFVGLSVLSQYFQKTNMASTAMKFLKIVEF